MDQLMSSETSGASEAPGFFLCSHENHGFLTEKNEDLKDIDKPLTSTVFWKKCRISGALLRWVITYYCSHILLSMGLVQIEGGFSSTIINPIPKKGLHLIGVGTPTISTWIPLQAQSAIVQRQHLFQYIMIVMVWVSILNFE